MSRFNAFLRDTGQRLTLPKTTKSQILVEIAADLEDLFEHFVRQGLSEEEAAARAEEKVDISTEALSELVLIHSDSHSWPARVAGRAQPFWERMAFALIVVFMAVMVVSGLDARLLSLTSSFVWPVLAIFVLLVISSIALGLRFARDRNHRRLRESLVTPVFLGGASLVVGFGGCAFELYRGFLRMYADAEQAGTHFVRAFFGGTTTLMLAILVALCAALVWFVGAGRVAYLERSAAATLKEV